MNQNKQAKAAASKNTDTVIGEGIVFESAVLRGNGIIRIDGKFSGTIDVEGRIILGEKGVIDGELTADSALIAGKYDGNLSIRNNLHLTPSAMLSGKVEAGRIIIDEGASISGSCNVTRSAE